MSSPIRLENVCGMIRGATNTAVYLPVPIAFVAQSFKDKVKFLHLVVSHNPGPEGLRFRSSPSDPPQRALNLRLDSSL